MDQEASIALVSCGDHNRLCSTYAITSYPSVRVFTGSVDQWEGHSGVLDSAHLLGLLSQYTEEEEQLAVSGGQRSWLFVFLRMWKSYSFCYDISLAVVPVCTDVQMRCIVSVYMQYDWCRQVGRKPKSHTQSFEVILVCA